MLFISLALAVEPRDALPAWRTYASISDITEPMDWFDAGYRGGRCRVGIPIRPLAEVRDDEIRRDCGHYVPPAGQPRHPGKDRYRRAKAVTRDERGFLGLDAVWLGAWREVSVEELAFTVPVGARGHRYGISSESRYALPMDAPGTMWLVTRSGGSGIPCMPGCPAGIGLDWAPPPALDGTSVVLGHLEDPSDPAYTAAVGSLEDAVWLAVAAMDRHHPPKLSDGVRDRFDDQVLAPGFDSTLVWTINAYGRPVGDHPLAHDRIAMQFSATDAMNGPITREVRAVRTDSVVVATLDLPGRRASVSIIGPDGKVQTAESTFELAVTGDASQAAVAGVARFEAREDRVVTFPGMNRYSQVDFYPFHMAAGFRASPGRDP